MGINCLPVLEVFGVVSRSAYSQHIHVALRLAQSKQKPSFVLFWEQGK